MLLTPSIFGKFIHIKLKIQFVVSLIGAPSDHILLVAFSALFAFLCFLFTNYFLGDSR